MPDVIFPLDSSKKFEDQVKVGHNRWHPEVPPVATVKPGDSFRAFWGGPEPLICVAPVTLSVVGTLTVTSSGGAIVRSPVELTQ